MLTITKTNVINVADWDSLVRKTYGRSYSFQQQDGCRSRGYYPITVPDDYDYDEEMHDDIPVRINGSKRGVKFATWLAADPKGPAFPDGVETSFGRDLWWSRNFYPDVNVVAKDLLAKGLLEPGEYLINVDW